MWASGKTVHFHKAMHTVSMIAVGICFCSQLSTTAGNTAANPSGWIRLGQLLNDGPEIDLIGALVTAN